MSSLILNRKNLTIKEALEYIFSDETESTCDNKTKMDLEDIESDLFSNIFSDAIDDCIIRLTKSVR